MPDVVLRSGFGIEVFAQNAAGTLEPSISFATPHNELAQIGDLNNDGRLDVIGLSSSLDGVTNAADAAVLHQNAAGGLATAVVVAAPHGVNDDMQLVDVNGDGLTDVVIMNGFTQPNITILYQLPGGSLSSPVTFDVLPGVVTHALAVGDVNGDGRKDIVVTFGGFETDSHIAVLLQNPDGSFATPAVFDTSDATGALETGDVNNDGRQDVVILHRDTIGVLLQRPDGGLGAEITTPTPFAFGHFQHGMVVTDINGDGLTDIAFAQNAGLVVLFERPANLSPAPEPDFARTQRDESVVISVLLNDGDPDGPDS